MVESYGEAAVIGVETRDIIQLRDAAPLAVTAMFRAIQRDRLTGDAPKLVMVDEAWSLLGSEHFAGTLASWAREMRKLKAVLALATQSLADLQKEETQVISDQIGNSIYLPQPEATRPETRRLYEAAGLTAEQIQLLATATPKGEYLLQTEELTRLVSFRLDGDALRLCGASSPGDIARARAMLAEGVRPGEEFTRLWLERTTAGVARRAGRAQPARGGVGRGDDPRPGLDVLRRVLARHDWRCCVCGRPCRDGDVWRHTEPGTGGDGPDNFSAMCPACIGGVASAKGAAPARYVVHVRDPGAAWARLRRVVADGLTVDDPARLRRVRRLRRLGGGAHAARRGLARGHDRPVLLLLMFLRPVSSAACWTGGAAGRRAGGGARRWKGSGRD